MYSLAAATRDTVQVWDINISSGFDKNVSVKRQGTRPSLYNADNSNGGLLVQQSGQVRVAVSSSDIIDGISTVSWASNGETFVVGGYGSGIRQYNSRTGEAIQDIKLNRRSERAKQTDIVSVQFYGARSDTLFVANNTTRQVCRWNLVRNEYAGICQTHENSISCMDVSTKMKAVATGTSHGGEIVLFNLTHNTRSDLYSTTQQALTSISISPIHRSQLVVGSEDGLLQLFDTTRSGANPLKLLKGVHSAPIRGLSFHPTTPGTIVSAGLDGCIVVSENGSRLANALRIRIGTPLSSLACCYSPHIIAAGTIDGEILVYDIRNPSTPLLETSVKKRQPVVSIEFSQGLPTTGSDRSIAPNPVRRSTSTLASKGNPARPFYNNRYSAIEDRHSSRYVDHRRLVDSTVAALSTDNDADSAGFRPPQHPAFNSTKLYRNRTLSNDHASAFSQPRRSNDMTSLDSANAGDSQEYPLEDDSVLMKDRSYMDLLSPEKPLLAPGNIQGIVGNDSSLQFGTRQNNYSNKNDRYSPANILSSDAKSRNLEIADSAKPQITASYQGNEIPQGHDIGDSIMEVFTPERPNKPKVPQAAELQPQKDSTTVGSFFDKLLGIRRNDDVAGQPPDRKTNDESHAAKREKYTTNEATKPTYFGADFSHGSKPSGDNHSGFDPKRGTGSTQINGNGNTARRDSHRHWDNDRENRDPAKEYICTKNTLESTYRNQRSDVDETHASYRSSLNSSDSYKNILEDSYETRDSNQTSISSQNNEFDKVPHSRSNHTNTHNTTSGTVDDGKRAVIVPPVNNISANDPPLVQSSSGSSISASLLQNALTDALVPLREQLRQEIRNLHLDMIKQNFVFQEQIRELSREREEARHLRAEVERLRKENAKLRQYIPFHNVLDNDHKP